jgi:hypothetical protein
MYFALNQNVERFDTYLSFLTDILNTGNQKYIDIFEGIIKEAKKLSKTNNFYSVQSERFGIIRFFARNEELLKSIDESHLKPDDFKNLHDYLKKEVVTEP